MSRIATSWLLVLGVSLSPDVLLSQDKADSTPPKRASFTVGSSVPRDGMPPKQDCAGKNCGKCPACQTTVLSNLAVATHTASAIGAVQQGSPSSDENHAAQASTPTQQCTDPDCRHCQAAVCQQATAQNTSPVPIFPAATTNRLLAEQLVYYFKQNQNNDRAIQSAIEQSLNFVSRNSGAESAQVHMVLGSDSMPPLPRPFYPSAKPDSDDMVELREIVKQNQRQVAMLARRIEELHSIDRADPLDNSLTGERGNHHVLWLRARIAELESQLATEKLLPVRSDQINQTLRPIEDESDPLRPCADRATGVTVAPASYDPARPVVADSEWMEPDEPTVMIAYDVTDLAQPPYFASVIELVHFIQSRVDEGNWNEDGIRIFAGGNTSISLVISQTPSGHRKIRYLFNGLRMDAAEWQR